jgi:hypothetical protein
MGAGRPRPRQLTWSQRLREWARLGREHTDKEIVRHDMRGDDRFIVLPEVWPTVREQVTDLLDSAELGGIPEATRWLDRRGFVWFTPKPEVYRARPPDR